ncbi:MAG: S41 family peptidase, partial [Planctomycetota bacterium]
IIDLRKNSGGNSGVGFGILAMLTDSPKLTVFKSKIPQYSAFRRARNLPSRPYIADDWNVDASDARNFEGPVVVLVGPETYSAAEDFLVPFKLMKIGKIVGEPTGGSTGQPLYFRLPGGGLARIVTKRDQYPDGSDFVGSGVEPEVIVRPSIQSIRAGEDKILGKALEIIGTGKANLE